MKNENFIITNFYDAIRLAKYLKEKTGDEHAVINTKDLSYHSDQEYEVVAWSDDLVELDWSIKGDLKPPILASVTFDLSENPAHIRALAFKLGKKYAQAGKPREANPHHIGETGFGSFDSGWCAENA